MTVGVEVIVRHTAKLNAVNGVEIVDHKDIARSLAGFELRGAHVIESGLRPAAPIGASIPAVLVTESLHGGLRNSVPLHQLRRTVSAADRRLIAEEIAGTDKHFLVIFAERTNHDIQWSRTVGMEGVSAASG